MKNIFNKKIIINNLLSAFGAFLCISLLSFLHFSEFGDVWLIPPFGASMVLVMAVHDSPLAEPKNIDSLSEKLQIALSIKNTERKKIIKHAQKLVETKFSHLKMCSETIKLYEKCIFESEIKHKLK